MSNPNDHCISDTPGTGWVPSLPPPTELVHLSPDIPVLRVRTGTPTDEQLILLAAEAQKKHEFEERLAAEQQLTAEQKQQKAQERKEMIQAKLPFQYLSQKSTNKGRLLGLLLWRYGMFNFFMEEMEGPEWKVSAPGKLDEDDKVWCCMALPEKVAAALSTPTQTAKEPYQRWGS